MKVLFNVPVNSYGHVETVIDSVTLFPGQAKTKQLTVLPPWTSEADWS